MRKMLMLLSVPLLVFCSPALGQITIPTNDFQPPLGTVFQNRMDATVGETFYSTLTTGSGGPMLWDFSTRPYGTGISSYIVSTASTPDIDSFPGANLVFLTPLGTDSTWSVHQSIPGSFTRLGTVSHLASIGEYFAVYRNMTADWVFPLAYGNQWTSFRHWTQDNSSGHTDVFDTTRYTVDGWGTAKYGSKSVPCLRVMAHEHFVYKLYDEMGTLINTFGADIYTAHFVAAGFNTLASVGKVVSPPSTTYTSSASGDFVATPTDVREVDTGTLPDGFSITQNYPNPFNPSTEFGLTVPSESHVKLAVYNILGREVKVLVDWRMVAGSYIVDWDGTDQSQARVPSGVYFYRLTADRFVATKKMILLR